MSGRGGRYGRALRLVAPLALVWVAFAAASSSAACPAGQDLQCGLSALGSVVGGDQCPSAAGGDQPARFAGARLQQLIEHVPCPASRRVSFGTTDDLGNPMGVLDVIADPAGGYLGVYHTAFGSPDDALAYRVSLAHSTDLLRWHRLTVLDAQGASMPTLRAFPGRPGFVLAYERAGPRAAPHLIRVRYYATRDDLAANRVGAERDLPLRFSPYNNGTPSILGLRWGGSLQRSVIEVGFHYETSRRGAPGPDREALGWLRGFRRWSAWPDTGTDAALDRQGLRGSHGDWRQFTFEAGWWRLYEAQTSFNDFSSWHVLLSGRGAGPMSRLSLKSGSAVVSSSFGNPVAQELPGPAGQGRVLVVTMFLFAASLPEEAGELVYYQPI